MSEDQSKDKKHAALGKPLKLGFLWILSGTAFKRQFKYRFCILTTTQELEWYKKQEDSVERKRGGVIKNLNECKIDEIEDQQGQQFCFSIKSGSRLTILAADTARDTQNWIVEILKFRGIPGLVALIQSSEKTASHGAYALANLAGRSKDDSPIQIVKHGAINPLINFQKNCQDKDLIDTIYYAFKKLSAYEENKLEVGTHLEYIYDLLKSDSFLWKEYALSTIVNCTTEPVIQTAIRLMDGIKPLVDLISWTFESAEVIDQGIKGSTLLSLSVDALANICQDDTNKVTFCSTFLDCFSGILSKFPAATQKSIIQIILSCCQSEESMDFIKQSQLLNDLPQLLLTEDDQLQEVTFKLLFHVIKDDMQHRFFRDHQSLLDNLLTTLSKESLFILESSLELIKTIWKDEFSPMLARKTGELGPLIALLNHPNPVIPEKVLYILNFLTSDRDSCQILGSSSPFVADFANKVVSLVTNTESTHVTSSSLRCLIRLSEINYAKVQLCRHGLFDKILLILSTEQNLFKVKLLKILANVLTLAVGKYYIRQSKGLGIICSYLSSDKHKIRFQAALLISLATTTERNFEPLSETNAVFRLITLIRDKASQSPLLVVAVDALKNLAFHPANESQIFKLDGLGDLIGLLKHSDDQVKAKALEALRNCINIDESKSFILKNALTLLQDLLSSKIQSIQLNSILILALSLGAKDESAALTAKKSSHGSVSILLQIVKEQRSGTFFPLLESSLFALTEMVSVDENVKLIINGDGFDLFLSLLVIENELVREYAAYLLHCCSKIALLQKPSLLNQKCLQYSTPFLGSVNSNLLEDIVSVLYQCSLIENLIASNKNALSEVASELDGLLNCSNLKIRENVVKILINSVMNEKNEIPINDVRGLEVLYSLLRRTPETAAISTSGLYFYVPSDGKEPLLQLKSRSQDPFLAIKYSDSMVLREHVAKTIIFCCHGKEYKPAQTRPNDSLKYKKKDSKEDSRFSPSSSSSLSIRDDTAAALYRYAQVDTIDEDPTLPTLMSPRRSLSSSSLTVPSLPLAPSASSSISASPPTVSLPSSVSVARFASSPKAIPSSSSPTSSVISSLELELPARSPQANFVIGERKKDRPKNAVISVGPHRTRRSAEVSDCPPDIEKPAPTSPTEIIVVPSFSLSSGPSLDDTISHVTTPPKKRRSGRKLTSAIRSTMKIIIFTKTTFISQLEAVAHYRSVNDPKVKANLSSISSYLRREYPKQIDPIEKIAFPLEESKVFPQISCKRKVTTGPGQVAVSLISLNEELFIAEYSFEKDAGTVAVVQSTQPLSLHQSYSYFEVLIINQGVSSSIGIGLAPADHPPNQQPGWQRDSFGYHGDDGNKYSFQCDRCLNEAYAGTFGTGDVIGCGYNHANQTIFFTKNGMVLDAAFSAVPPANSLFPTVGLASPSEKVFFNFGQNPFLWNFDLDNIALDLEKAPKAKPCGGSRSSRRNKGDPNYYELYFDYLSSMWMLFENPKTVSSSSLKNARRYLNLDDSFD